MIIDFHTHIFPDRIASKAIPLLSEKSKTEPFTDGTLSGLLESTERCGIDYSIILPVATSVKQVVSINDFSIDINKKNKKVISFGGMHPDFLDFESELLRLKWNGIKGIKLHPAYQNTPIDDERYVRIIDKAFELGLIVIIHAGIDIGIDGETMASPDRILRCKELLNHDGIFILAHMGSWKMWDEVYDKILGKGFYIDTAFSLDKVIRRDGNIEFLNTEDFERFVSKQGSEKVLFASDSPWADQKQYLDFIRNSSLSQTEKDNILGLNAKRLLNL